MLLNIALGAFMTLVTTGIHTGGMLVTISVMRKFRTLREHRLPRNRLYAHPHRVGGLVLLMFLVSVLEVTAWAGLYLVLHAIEGLEKAVYFSMVTFTTLGYGEIVLDERWRLLASFEAANGIIMFGWTTAIVIAVVQRIYFSPERDASRDAS